VALSHEKPSHGQLLMAQPAGGLVEQAAVARRVPVLLSPR
jgi:hypothetical protein